MSTVYISKTDEINNFLNDYITHYKLKSLDEQSKTDNVKNRKQEFTNLQTPAEEMLKSRAINLDKLLELIAEYSKLKGCTIVANDILKNSTIMNRIEQKVTVVDDNKIIEEQKYQRLIAKFKPRVHEKVLPPLGIGLNAIITVIMTFIGVFYIAMNHVKTSLVIGVSVALVASFIAITVECILFIIKF